MADLIRHALKTDRNYTVALITASSQHAFLVLALSCFLSISHSFPRANTWSGRLRQTDVHQDSAYVRVRLASPRDCEFCTVLRKPAGILTLDSKKRWQHNDGESSLHLQYAEKVCKADLAVEVYSTEVCRVEMKNDKAAVEQNYVSKCTTCFHGYHEITTNMEKWSTCPGWFSATPFFRVSSCHGDSRSAQSWSLYEGQTVKQHRHLLLPHTRSTIYGSPTEFLRSSRKCCCSLFCLHKEQESRRRDAFRSKWVKTEEWKKDKTAHEFDSLCRESCIVGVLNHQVINRWI